MTRTPSTGPTTAVRLSLAPAFRRGWSSVSDALTTGAIDVPLLRRLPVAALPRGLPLDGCRGRTRASATERPLWALDASTWPQPSAHTSAERTDAHRVATGTPQSGVIAGWEYHWLLAVPEAQGSWVLPLDIA